MPPVPLASSVPESVSAGYKAQYRINNEWLKTDVGQLEVRPEFALSPNSPYMREADTLRFRS
jgi:hypothetical protein